VLRNWSYYELMAKIKYKAEKAGIELITDWKMEFWGCLYTHKVRLEVTLTKCAWHIQRRGLLFFDDIGVF
jgi:hypothetical protein